MTKAAQIGKALETAERIRTIRKLAAARWALQVIPEEQLDKTAATKVTEALRALDQVGHNPGIMDRIRSFNPHDFLRRDVLSAVIGGGVVAAAERAINAAFSQKGGSRRLAWNRLVKRYPEFDDDQHRELFEAVHAFSPTVASVSSTVAPILRSASDYGTEGIDIGTAKTLSSIEGRSAPGYFESNLTPRFIYTSMRDAAKDARDAAKSGVANNLARPAGTV